MSPRRRNRGPEISLFPFLSVMAVVIGTLTLIISGISLGEITADPKPAIAELARLEHEIAANAERTARLNQLVVRAEALASDLEKRRARAAQLESARPDGGVAQDPVDVSLRELEQLKTRKSDAERSLELVHDRLATKTAEFDAVRKLAEAPESRLLLTGQGSAKGKRPSFVECTAQGLVLDAQLGDLRHTLVPRGDIENSSALSAFFREVNAREDGLAVFVIRPGGVASWEQAQAALQQNGTTSGYMAAPSHQALDYQLFLAKQ